jgi:heat shock protein HslJ
MSKLIGPNAWLAAALLLAVVLAACGRDSGSGGLNDTEWALDSLSGAAALDGVSATMTFADDDQLFGSASCNRYTGTWEDGDDDALTLTPGAMTRMACDEPVMSQEQAFIAAMTNTASYRRDGDELTLRDSAGNDLATLDELDPADLVDTPWEVTHYNTGQQAVVSVIEGSNLTAVFGDDGMINGSGGCNSFSAAYETDDETITIDAPVSTLIACDQPIMDQEAAYFQALQQAATFELGEDTLALHAADGALLVSYVTAD